MDEFSINKKWTHERKLLLITTRLKHEQDFCSKIKKKNTLWEQVLREILLLDENFPFTRDDIARCFLNLMGTYRRIKKRNQMSGEAPTNWEFFAQFDEIYGTRSSVEVPAELLDSSIDRITKDLTEDCALSEMSYSPIVSTPVQSSKKKNCEIMNFLQQEAEEDNKIVREMLEVEKQKIEMEKQKIEELKKLRELLENFCQNNK